MNKTLFFTIALLVCGIAHGKGKIQNEDVKSLNDITTAVLTTTGTFTSGSPCLSGLGTTSGLVVGLYAYNLGSPSSFPAGVTIAGLPGTCPAGQVQLSANVTGSGSTTFTFGGTASQLIQSNKIYDVFNGQQLSVSITNGQIGSGSATSGQVLTANGAGATAWLTPPASQWITSGSDIYYTTGKVGIGTSATPASIFEINSTTGPTFTLGRSSNVGATSEPGYIEWRAPNASSVSKLWNQIKSYVVDATNGSEDSDLVFSSEVGGSFAEVARLSGTSLGLGVSPSTALDVRNATGAIVTAGRTQNVAALAEPGSFQVQAPNASAALRTWSNMRTVVQNPALGSEAADVVFSAQSAGSFTEMLRLSGTPGAAVATVNGRIAATNITPPTVQKFTSGSGTYNTPANVIYLEVIMVGAGGGGGGGGTAGQTAGGTGGNTTFGTSLLTANGGNGGREGNTASGQPSGGAGGTATVSSPAYGTAMQGGTGGYGWNMAVAQPASGGAGASSALGGGGNGGAIGTGNAGINNTGGGGQGGGCSVGSGQSGAGGGAGGYIRAIIPSPTTSYSYSVGTAGTAGNSGTNGFLGGAGASGYIEVIEHYI